MINLMPTDAKSAVQYARYNLHMLHWTIGCLLIIVAMGATVVLGGFYIDSAKTNLSTSITDTKDTISTQKLDKVQAQAEDLSAGVKLILQVLSKEVLFSKLLQQIGGIMPPGATLGDISLTNNVTGALNLTANAVDYRSATQVQLNLQDSKNNLFDKVDTTNISCSDAAQASTSTISSKYKCQILIRALFKSTAAVTFLATPPSAVKPVTP